VGGLNEKFKVLKVKSTSCCVQLSAQQISSMYCVWQTLQQWRTQEFFSGGGSTNSVEDRENGDLGTVAP